MTLSWKSLSQSKGRYVLLLYLTGILAFWAMRIGYWRITHEAPFSDMTVYLAIAHHLMTNFDFRFTDFWQSYKPPTLPILMALNFTLFGDGNLTAWQFFQTAILFLSLLWLCAELTWVTRNKYLGPVLVWVVALSKSSIFWSYKTATESTGEAFIYLCAAGSLFTLRRGNSSAFIFLGALYSVAMLLRPQFVVAIFFFCVWFAIGRLIQRKLDRATVVLLGCFVGGFLIPWLPWAVRTYRHYGHVLPTSTQGPYTFLWEVGPVTLVRPDGTQITRDVSQLQAEAATRFANDYEAMAFADQFVRKWLKDNYRELPEIVLHRAENTIADRREYLTRVSRTQLFPGWYNELLIDKTPLLVAGGLLGLMLLVLLYSSSIYPVATVPIGFWMLGFLMMSYQRMADPCLPLFLFGNVAWFVLASRMIARIRKRGENDLGQQSS